MRTNPSVSAIALLLWLLPPPACSEPKAPRRRLHLGRCRGDDDGEEEELERSAAAAEAAGVVLLADSQLQDAALGLYDTQQMRFGMSDTQVGRSVGFFGGLVGRSPSSRQGCC